MEHIQYLDVLPSAENVFSVFWGYGLQGWRRMSPQQDVTLPARVSADPWRKHKCKSNVNLEMLNLVKRRDVKYDLNTII